jgi:small-conductance mechanosensitive channel/CRP-like cAMP-binding protein
VTDLLWRLLLPAAIVVLLAAVFRVVPTAPRRRLRRSVLLLGMYAAVAITAALLVRAGFETVAGVFRFASDLLGLLLLINVAALATFDLLLLRWDYPDILHDLVVGAAYLVAIFWLMSRSGVNLTSIVATSAVVTAVLGLSLQATLGNVIGGLALQIDDSIQEGDWIELENRSQGQVKKVRWRHTVIETRDWDTLVVPNSQLLSQTIKILGKREGAPLQHRMWVYFHVDYRFSPTEVIRVVDEALQAAPIDGIASDPKPHCICFDLAREHRDSYCYYAVRYWLRDIARDDPANSAVRERIYAALKRAGMPLAVPAKTVFVSHDDPEHTERKRMRERELKRAAMASVELFARLSVEELDTLADTTRITPFAPREIVTRQGAKAQWLYVLTKGRAEVRVASAGGEERAVAVLEAPSFFGEMALMTGQPREATVIALTAVECLRVDKADFQGILERRPEIVQEVSTVLAQRRVELQAARENLDADARNRKIQSERGKMVEAIRDFFGLDRS